MSDTTKIQWADATFNPWIGCTKVSLGCKYCYMEKSTPVRVLRAQGRDPFGKGNPRKRTSEAMWRKPIQWSLDAGQRAIDHNDETNLGKDLGEYTPPRIFPSLCDWLDYEVPIEWLADFLKLIHDTPNLTWLLLTKRPENFKSRLHAVNLAQPETGFDEVLVNFVSRWIDGHAPSNVWLGTSVENQAMADKRIPELLQIPAAVRFLSVEPMLEAIDLKFMQRSYGFPKHITAQGHAVGMLQGIHWTIFGGESGKDARTCNIEWISDGVKQCKAAGVAAFVKQLGADPIWEQWPKCEREMANLGRVKRGWLKDRKGGDMAEWPEDLRVREFPV